MHANWIERVDEYSGADFPLEILVKDAYRVFEPGRPTFL